MSRTRSTSYNGPYNRARYRTVKVADPNPAWIEISASQWRLSNSSTMTDVVTAGFRRLQREGYIINMPASRSVSSLDHIVMTGKMLTTRSTDGFWYETQILNSVPEQWCKNTFSSISLHYAQPSYPSLDVDYVLQRAWADLDKSSAAILSTLGEMDETFAFARSVISRTCRVFRNLKRGLFLSPEALRYWRSVGTAKQCGHVWRQLVGSPPARWPVTLRTAWLEARYALRPLAYDFMAIKKAMEEPLKPLRVTGRSYAVQSNQNVHFEDAFMCLKMPTQGSSSAVVGTMGSQFTYTSVRKRTVRAGVLAKLDVKSQLGSYADAFGLHNLPEAAWDLTAFSFVLDWFLDISTYIEAWTPEPGVHPLASWIHTEDVWTETLACRPYDIRRNGSYTDQITGSPGLTTRITRSWTRTPNPTLSILPHINVRLNGYKVADLIALISQFLHRR